MKEETVSSQVKYECSFLTLYEDEVLLPNKKQAKRIYVNHLGAACVLPITKDNKIILTKQYRYPIKAISLEIPAGKKDHKDEVGLDCVKRELEEETNYQSNSISYLTEFYNCVGYSNELIELYIAKDCYLVEQPRQADEDEFIEVEIYTLKQVKELIKNKTIKDVKTILAISLYEQLQ